MRPGKFPNNLKGFPSEKKGGIIPPFLTLELILISDLIGENFWKEEDPNII
jgi:hypothetical protein